MTQPPERPILPDAGTVQFLANAADTRENKIGTVYGAGHITTYDTDDLDFIKACYLDGKIALIDPLPDPVEFEQPQNYPPPQTRSKRTEEQPKLEQPKEQPKQQEQPRRR